MPGGDWTYPLAGTWASTLPCSCLALRLDTQMSSIPSTQTNLEVCIPLPPFSTFEGCKHLYIYPPVCPMSYLPTPRWRETAIWKLEGRYQVFKASTTSRAKPSIYECISPVGGLLEHPRLGVLASSEGIRKRRWARIIGGPYDALGRPLGA